MSSASLRKLIGSCSKDYWYSICFWNGIQYVQIAASVRDETTLARELASPQRISDNYPKVILTLDEDPEADYEGIRRINALEWLIGKADFSWQMIIVNRFSLIKGIVDLIMLTWKLQRE